MDKYSNEFPERLRHTSRTSSLRIANRSAIAATTALFLCAPLAAFSPATEGVARAATTVTSTANAVSTNARTDSAKGEARSLSRAFRSAAKTLAPSVVTINTVSRAQPASGPSMGAMPPGMLPPGFQLPPNMQMPKQGPARGTGTGAVISRDGYIVTANHVVADAEEIEIVFQNGRTERAEIVGLDPGTDIAVLKTNASGLEPASFGSSDELEIGDWVVAIGAPFGLEQTVTAGIVSAKSRSDVGLATFESYIQTDAAINPGNSGGPLANLDGEIIGINSCISSKGGGNDGIGFAVPASVAKRVVDAIIADGRVSRGWLGIAVQPADDDMAASLGAEGAIGVVVNEVVAGSPAQKAGLEPGDLITEVGGAKVRTPGELVATIGQRSPGSELSITAIRAGEREEFSATLGERADDAKQKLKTPKAKPSATALEKLGLTLTELSASDAAGMGITAEDGALAVERVEEEGPAAAAGVAPGDVIRRIGSRNTRTLDEANAALDAMREGASVPLLVERDGRARFVLVKPAGASSADEVLTQPAPRRR
ncbi:MAG: Do family serine endopeptidase [bacterium]